MNKNEEISKISSALKDVMEESFLRKHFARCVYVEEARNRVTLYVSFTKKLIEFVKEGCVWICKVNKTGHRNIQTQYSYKEAIAIITGLVESNVMWSLKHISTVWRGYGEQVDYEAFTSGIHVRGVRIAKKYSKELAKRLAEVLESENSNN